MQTHELTLPDGRRLAYTDTGGRGAPVLYMHGIPGSRMPDALFVQLAGQMNLRLITPERPGFGLSTHDPGRSIRSWAADVHTLLAGLFIRKTALLGHAGGVPYALSVASALPDRVTRVALVSGFTPDASVTPFPDDALRERAAALASERPTDSVMDRMIVATLAGREDGDYVAGVAGYLLDYALLADDWGLPLHDIHSPAAVWHGENDERYPLATAGALADALPHARLFTIPDAGHRLPAMAWRSIFRGLTSS